LGENLALPKFLPFFSGQWRREFSLGLALASAPLPCPVGVLRTHRRDADHSVEVMEQGRRGEGRQAVLRLLPDLRREA
jgi:hypothetical protein